MLAAQQSNNGAGNRRPKGAVSFHADGMGGGGGGSLSTSKSFCSRLYKLPGSISRSFHGWSTPLFVPARQTIELFFFQRIFEKLCEEQKVRLNAAGINNPAGQYAQAAPLNLVTEGDLDDDDGSEALINSTMDFENPPDTESCEVPLVQFHRAMVRLFRILGMSSPDVGKFAECDANSNGKVGWYEFCSFWANHQIQVHLTIAERVFLTLEDADRSVCGRIMSIVVFLAILISTGCFILSTIPSFQTKCVLEGDPFYDETCKPETDDFFKTADLTCVIFFSIEYGCRLLLSGVMRMELVDKDRKQLLHWMVTEDNIREPSFIRRVRAWFFNTANLIDLCAIMPWFLSKSAEAAGGGDNFAIRLIRLTRVIRAIRLGKKFEAVIIVARTVKRSLRALYVLVLNVILGVIVSGSLMYFCEQGKWDSERRAYMRVESQDFNPITKEWDDHWGRSPYDSIPSCFWWAIVTATTVGYGDTYPTTPAGKAIAGVSMAWSLCVLALPIGVIGTNFRLAWEEFDREKDLATWNAIKEKTMLKRSIAWGDPLHYSRQILLEVWHDPDPPVKGKCDDPDFPVMGKSGMESDSQAEFMGEVAFELEVTRGSQEVVHRTFCAPLESNLEKARRRVRGVLTFEYTWTPDVSGSELEDALLFGKLEVTVVSGDDLIAIDWKGSCASDPYVVVVAYPKSPPEDGKVEPVWYKSETEADTSTPAWNFKCDFDVHWTGIGTQHCMAADMRQIGTEEGLESSPVVSAPNRATQSAGRQSGIAVSGSNRPSGSGGMRASSMSPGVEPTEKVKLEMMSRMVPELQDEVNYLQSYVVPSIKKQVSSVQKDLEEIVSTLMKERGIERLPGSNGLGRMSVDSSVGPASSMGGALSSPLFPFAMADPTQSPQQAWGSPCGSSPWTAPSTALTVFQQNPGSSGHFASADFSEPPPLVSSNHTDRPDR